MCSILVQFQSLWSNFRKYKCWSMNDKGWFRKFLLFINWKFEISQFNWLRRSCRESCYSIIFNFIGFYFLLISLKLPIKLRYSQFFIYKKFLKSPFMLSFIQTFPNVPISIEKEIRFWNRAHLLGQCSQNMHFLTASLNRQMETI